MVGLAKIKNFEPGIADYASVAQKGLVDVNDVWAAVGENFDEGINLVAAQMGIDQSWLIALLAVDGLTGVKRRIDPRPFGLRLGLRPLLEGMKWAGSGAARLWSDRAKHWKSLKKFWLGVKLLWIIPKWLAIRLKQRKLYREQYWPDAFIIIVLLLLIGLGVRASYIHSAFVDQVSVNKDTNLSPFHGISAGDLTLIKGSKIEGAFASTSDVVGRYTLESMLPGTLLHDKKLLTREVSQKLIGRQFISVPVKVGILGSSFEAGADVWLLFSPRNVGEQTAQAWIAKDVIFLAQEVRGDVNWAIVAMKEEDLETAKQLLGISDVFVLLPAK